MNLLSLESLFFPMVPTPKVHLDFYSLPRADCRSLSHQINILFLPLAWRKAAIFDY